MKYILPALYLLVSAYLIGTQGLFGESFIALILGMPWTIILAYFEFFNATPPLAYVLIFGPIALNAAIMMWYIGSLFGKKH